MSKDPLVGSEIFQGQSKRLKWWWMLEPRFRAVCLNVINCESRSICRRNAVFSSTSRVTVRRAEAKPSLPLAITKQASSSTSCQQIGSERAPQPGPNYASFIRQLEADIRQSVFTIWSPLILQHSSPVRSEFPGRVTLVSND
ncbi:unnamed protein product [Calypogeia fissa]